LKKFPAKRKEKKTKKNGKNSKTPKMKKKKYPINYHYQTCQEIDSKEKIHKGEEEDNETKDKSFAKQAPSYG
jgi:hypothetical protein